jgi:NitT/TauT family transport system ATP-binding protein
LTSTPQATEPRSRTGTAINVQNLSKRYATRDGEVLALRDVSVDVREDEFLSLVGPSGCGKSTLLKVIAGLEPYDDGQVSVRGTDPAPGRPDVGIMLQSPVLLPWRTVLANVLLPCQIQKRNLRDGESRARQALSAVRLEGFMDKYPWELSGGMQQRASLARLLVLDPDVMLLDEPFSALDEFNREKLTLDLAALHNELHRTAVYVTHNIAESVLLSDRVVVLKPHPGEVLDVVDIDLPRPRDRHTLSSPEAVRLVTAIRDLLFASEEEQA